MSGRVLDLDHPSNMASFTKKLGACEYAMASRASLSETQDRFVKQMRAQLDSRDHDYEVTRRKWNPTVNQWNYLGGIYEKL